MEAEMEFRNNQVHLEQSILVGNGDNKTLN